MFGWLRRLFGSKKRAHVEVAQQAATRLPPPPAPPAAEPPVWEQPQPQATPAPQPQATPAPVVTPHSPEPAPAAIEPSATVPAPAESPEPPPPGALRLIYPDGRVEEVRPEGEVGERIAYLVDNLLPPDPETKQVSRTLKGEERSPLSGRPGSVRLMFEDGHVEDLPADPEMQARIAYLVDNILHREASERGAPPS